MGTVNPEATAAFDVLERCIVRAGYEEAVILPTLRPVMETLRKAVIASVVTAAVNSGPLRIPLEALQRQR
jgi:hypothetical protein